jgi:hypothetical protein
MFINTDHDRYIGKTLLDAPQRRGKIKERILRVLLNNPDGTSTKYRVAKLTESGFPWVHEYLKQLEHNHLVDGTRVLDYRGLIETWVSIRRSVKTIDYMVQEPEKLLMETGLDFAMTTYRAEALTQGYLFPSRTDIYIKPGEEEIWGRALIGRGLKGKGNLRLLIDEEHVFYASRIVQGVRVVSPPQLIVDLLLEGGVCVEAAEMLLGKVVKEPVSVG